MDEKRKGEIALSLLKYRLGLDMKRELTNLAKATEIPLDELKEFGKLLVEDFLEEIQ